MLWEASVAPGPRESGHQKNGPASATPATDGERVYVSLGSRGLVALDLDGNRLWHTEVGRIDNYHGPAGSPLLHDERLFIYQDQRRGGFVAAYDTATGAEVWRTAREAPVGWGTPVLIRAGDHDELVVSSSRTVNAYDPATGAELWRCEGNNFEVIPTPVVEAGLVFCTSGRAGPTLAIRPGGNGDVTNSHVAWTTARGSPFVPSPLAYDGRLYTINDMASVVTAFRATTGDVLWQGRLGRAAREGFSASPVYVDGKVFFTNDDGITFVLRAGDQFELLTRTTSARGRWHRRRWWTATGTSGPKTSCSPSATRRSRGDSGESCASIHGERGGHQKKLPAVLPRRFLGDRLQVQVVEDGYAHRDNRQQMDRLRDAVDLRRQDVAGCRPRPGWRHRAHEARA